MSKRLISFIIPAYNEEESLPLLVKQLDELSYKIQKQYDIEIIIIDDGSTDKTVEVSEKAIKTLPSSKVIALRRNFGKAAALNAGFRLAQGDIIFTMDADLQDDPQEIPRFIEKLDAGFDMVSGWKKKRHDPFHKVIPSRLFNAVISKASGLSLHDYNCGFKAYKKEVVEQLVIYGEMHRYIPALAHAKGFKVCEIVVTHHARQFGKSKYGVERFLKGFFDFTTIVFITQYFARPMHFFGKWGLILFSGGLFINAYLSLSWIWFNLIKKSSYSLSDRPLLLLGILLMLIGTQFFFTGLISEMILSIDKSRNNSDNSSIIKTIFTSKKSFKLTSKKKSKK